MARPALRIDVSARDQKALRKLVSGGGQASACGSPCVGPFAAAEATLQSHWCPAIVLPHVGSVRLFAVSYKADPAHGSSKRDDQRASPLAT